MFAEADAAGFDVEIGSTAELGVGAYMSNGTALTPESITYESLNTGVATVDNGTVTGVSAGTATISSSVTADSVLTGNVVLPLQTKVRVTGAEIAADATEKTVSLSVTTNVSGYKVKVNGAAPESDIYVNSVPIGTTVTLEAPEIPGYKLVGWKRGTADGADTKYITLADDNTYTVWTGTYLTAVYDEVTPENEKTVEFWDQNGAYIGKMDEETYNSKKGNLFTPSLVGYEFINWFVDKTTKLTDLAELPYGVTRAFTATSTTAMSSEKKQVFARRTPERFQISRVSLNLRAA